MVLTVGVNTVHKRHDSAALGYLSQLYFRLYEKRYEQMYTCDSSESYQYHTCASIEIEVKTQPEDATNFR